MKKVIFILVALLTLSSLFSCKIHDNLKNDKNHINSNTISMDKNEKEQNFNQQQDSSYDIFIGTITSSSPLDNSVIFPNFDNLNYSMNIYTVKVEKIFSNFLLTEDTVIRVVGISTDDKTAEKYADAFEVGKKYIMSGMVQPYNNVPVIFTVANMSAQITDDGKIIPISTPAEQMYAGIETLEQLEKNADFIELCQSDDIFIPKTFYNEEKELTNDSTATLNPEKAKTKQEVIETIREAIKVDSKVKMDISYDNYPNDDTK